MDRSRVFPKYVTRFAEQGVDLGTAWPTDDLDKITELDEEQNACRVLDPLHHQQGWRPHLHQVAVTLSRMFIIF